ncbi:hypothetical protein AB205_0072660 [Aquarana catesbeiana]|uniref:Protein kinase domain-containing protein n=1 Tax=Aquarana catesbeiana TaxID=8400 RepID=A0A2G9RDH3_AQUCT|nr:hypothetical protein AB205_0072660 [Aquarana catesbeiana]
MSAELCGVQLLHSRGIIHRDLKPANILIHLNGHVKIADFGAAATGMFGRYLEEDDGTFLYYAPELINEEPYNQRQDYFSLGVLLYEAAFRVLPFLRDGISRLLDSIVNETPFYPDDADPNLCHRNQAKKKINLQDIMDKDEAISAREQALFNGFSFISEEWIAMQK